MSVYSYLDSEYLNTFESNWNIWSLLTVFILLPSIILLVHLGSISGYQWSISHHLKREEQFFYLVNVRVCSHFKRIFVPHSLPTDAWKNLNESVVKLKTTRHISNSAEGYILSLMPETFLIRNTRRGRRFFTVSEFMYLWEDHLKYDFCHIPL